MSVCEVEEKVIQIPESAKNTADLTGLTFTKNFRGFGSYTGHIEYFDEKSQTYRCHMVYAETVRNNDDSKTGNSEFYENYSHKRLVSMGCVRVVQDQKWADGAKVFCQWDGDSKWWPAVIVKMQSNGKYVVQYDEDKTMDDDVSPNRIASRFKSKKWKLSCPFGKRQVQCAGPTSFPVCHSTLPRQRVDAMWLGIHILPTSVIPIATIPPVIHYSGTYRRRQIVERCGDIHD